MTAAQPSLIPLRVLLLGPEGPARELLRGVLEGGGLLVRAGLSAASLGQEALHASPHLLLAMLPEGGDAAALAGSLRKMPGFAGTALLIMAGPGDENARYQAIAAGADDFLVEPVPVEVLLATAHARIARSLAGASPAPGSERHPRAGQLRRGEFIEQLGLAFQDASEPWQVLIAVSVDQSRALKRPGTPGQAVR